MYQEQLHYQTMYIIKQLHLIQMQPLMLEEPTHQYYGIKSAGETVSNLRNQISEVGKGFMNKIEDGGRYSNVKQSDNEDWEVVDNNEKKGNIC